MVLSSGCFVYVMNHSPDSALHLLLKWRNLRRDKRDAGAHKYGGGPFIQRPAPRVWRQRVTYLMVNQSTAATGAALQVITYRHYCDPKPNLGRDPNYWGRQPDAYSTRYSQPETGLRHFSLADSRPAPWDTGRVFANAASQSYLSKRGGLQRKDKALV